MSSLTVAYGNSAHQLNRDAKFEDATTIAAVPNLVAFAGSEVNNPDAYAAFETAMPDWRQWFWREYEVPWLTNLPPGWSIDDDDSGHLDVPDLGVDGGTKARHTTWLKVHGPDGERLGLVNLHRVNNGFGNDPDPQKALRRKAWQKHHAADRSLVHRLLAAGYPVLIGGDWNRIQGDIPLLHRDQRWLTDGGIQCVAVIAAPDQAVTGEARRVRINSDHPLIVATVDVTATTEPPERPPQRLRDRLTELRAERADIQARIDDKRDQLKKEKP